MIDTVLLSSAAASFAPLTNPYPYLTTAGTAIPPINPSLVLPSFTAAYPARYPACSSAYTIDTVLSLISGSDSGVSAGAPSINMNLTSGYLDCAWKIGSWNKNPGVAITLAPALTARSICSILALLESSAG